MWRARGLGREQETGSDKIGETSLGRDNFVTCVSRILACIIFEPVYK